MSDRTSIILAALDAMSLYDVDNITGLDTTADDGWRAVIEKVTDTVREAYQWGEVSERHPTDVASVAAARLVPIRRAELTREFATIRAVFDVDLALCRGGAERTMSELISEVLHEVYRDGVTALITHLESVAAAHDDDGDGGDGGEPAWLPRAA